jgi:hypothetical protein
MVRTIVATRKSSRQPAPPDRRPQRLAAPAASAYAAAADARRREIPMPDPAPDTPPVPRRYYWLKRLLGLGLLAVLLLVGLRLVWGYRANARYAALIAEIEATGDPIHFEDLVIEPVPDQDNKAYHLKQALAAWPTVPGQGVLITDTDWYAKQDEPNPPPDPITDNAAYLQQLQPALAHLRRMDTATGCDWGVRPVSPVIHWSSAHLGQLREQARLIDDAARRAHDAGNAIAMFELIELELGAGETTNTNNISSLIDHLVKISVHALACETIEQVTPTLDVSADRDDPVRQRAEAMIARLRDETGLHESRSRGFVGERWMAHDTGLAVMDGRLGLNQLMPGGGPGFGFYLTMGLFKPVLVNDIALLHRYLTAIVEASREAESLPAFEAAFADRFNEAQLDVIEQRPMLHMFSRIMMSAFDAAIRTHCQVLATQRMAATALAIRLYEADHGQRPETLDQLVPDYLPAVPRDPFTLDEPIKYRPEGAKLIEWRHVRDGKVTGPPLPETGPAILYSVGSNETDHGGLVVLDRQGQLDRRERLREGDQWFLLDPELAPYTLP